MKKITYHPLLIDVFHKLISMWQDDDRLHLHVAPTAALPHAPVIYLLPMTEMLS